MNTSSAIKAPLNFSDPSADDTNQFVSSPAVGSAASTKVEFPSLDAYGGPATYAISARLAGRINAANVSSDEHSRLLREREELIKKKLNNSLTRRESHRLEYVRWSLDRIEDARYGYALDDLEGLVEYYERFEADLKDLKAKLEEAKKSK
jgi:hypothetical protein